MYDRAEGGVFVWEKSGRVRPVASDGTAPDWSPDGRRIAFVAPSVERGTDVYVIDADGRHRGRITRTPGRDEDVPDWSPDGRRLVVQRAGRVVVIGADGLHERVLGVGSEPAWSPDGRRIAFIAARAGVTDVYSIEPSGYGLRQLTKSPAAERSPAWSPDSSKLAFVSDDLGAQNVWVLTVESGAAIRLTDDAAAETAPLWAPDGRTVIYRSTDSFFAVAATGGAPAPFASPQGMERARWRPARSPELRPDLDQQAPGELSIQVSSSGRFRLGFRSATDNVGEGPLAVFAVRASPVVPTMQATQRVRVAGGGLRTYPAAGFLRYTYSPEHSHWHLMGFQRYELRSAADHRLLLRDRKSGFCLNDRWGNAAQGYRGPRRRPVFTDYCRRGLTGAMFVSQGTSVGYSDIYPAHYHGQNLDVTRIPAGTYVLVHRANPNLSLRELRYENNASALRIRLTWPGGRGRRPHVLILQRCPASEYCP